MDSKDELLEDDEQEIKPDEEEEGQEKQNKNDNFHVLAVDDSLIDRKILEKLLTHSSYHVTCVESGDKALEYLGLVDHHRSSIDHHHLDHDPDIHSSFTPSDHQHHQVHETRVNLIMTDYSMPGITGYDLLKKVKGSSWKDVPVVVMSSENVPSRIHMCLEGGAEEFLLKPVRESDVKKLHPHLLKSVCCGNNTRAKLAETSCNLGVNQSPNHGDYEEEIMIRDLSSCFDKGKAKVDDDQCLDRRRVNMEGLTAPVNV